MPTSPNLYADLDLEQEQEDKNSGSDVSAKQDAALAEDDQNNSNTSSNSQESSVSVESDSKNSASDDNSESSSSVYTDKYIKQNEKINFVKQATNATQVNVNTPKTKSTIHLKAMGAFQDIYNNINENNIRINIKNQERKRAQHRQEKLTEAKPEE